MKKKGLLRLVVFLSVFLLSGMVASLVVHADVIWEPRDSFYQNEYDRCEYEGRTYLSNGSEGFITVYESPRSSKIIEQFENGNSFYVSFTYTGLRGDEWGVVQFKRDENDQAVLSYSNDATTGWIPMGDLLVCYDHFSFCVDHQDDFEAYTGSFDAQAYEGEILFWTYPGSGVVSSTVDMNHWDGEQMSFDHTYTDESARQWGYVGYFYSHSGWVCISDPTNENLPVNEMGYEDLIPAAKPEKPVVSGNITFLIGLVAGVVILTAVLIGIFFRRKQRS